MVEVEKMTKKQKREYYKKHRVVNGFNTGSRTMKSAKYPTRAMQKDAERKNQE